MSEGFGNDLLFTWNGFKFLKLSAGLTSFNIQVRERYRLLLAKKLRAVGDTATKRALNFSWPYSIRPAKSTNHSVRTNLEIALKLC